MPPPSQPALPQQASTFQIHGEGDCCRGSGPRAPFRLSLTPPGFASSPNSCMALCLANTTCAFFSFSVRWQDCVLCRACELKTSSPASQEYTSWRHVPLDVVEPQPSNETLVLLTTAMRFEQCYLKEWFSHHFSVGVSRIYVMPQVPLGATRTKEDEAYLRGFKVDDWRVQPLCNVSGQVSGCNSLLATPYVSRSQQQEVIRSYLAPRHRNAWLMLLDLDEFLHAKKPVAGLKWEPCGPQTLSKGGKRLNHSRLEGALARRRETQFTPGELHSFQLGEVRLGDFIQVGSLCFEAVSMPRTIMSVLGTFSSLGAELVIVPWRVHGPNRVNSNPSCATQRMFPIPTDLSCPYNNLFKPLFRMKSTLQPLSPHDTNAHHLFNETLNEFAADGTNISSCRSKVPFCKFCSAVPPEVNDAHSKFICPVPPLPKVARPKYPMLELRHYMTRSASEYRIKMHHYADPGARHGNSRRYTGPGSEELFKRLNRDRASPAHMGATERYYGSSCGMAADAGADHARRPPHYI